METKISTVDVIRRGSNSLKATNIFELISDDLFTAFIIIIICVNTLLASYSSLNTKTEEKINYYEGIPVPKDKYCILHILFLLFGMLHLMTITFLITANNYWMFKFRNVSMNDADIENENDRTTLQSYFTSGTAVAQAIPTIVCTLWSTTYGHKFKVRSRIYVSLIVILACYLLCTVCIMIDVSGWQTGFFALTMVELFIIQAMLALFQVTSLVILSKFPLSYMKPFLFGQGIAGIFSSSLQVVCLAIGGVPEISALIYFSIGSFLILLTIILFATVKYLNIYKYYMTIHKEDTKRKAHSYADSMKVVKLIWPCLVIFMTYVATLAATHPSITSLVKSEARGHVWNDKYFVPVITFLFSDICSLLGRVFARGLLTHSNGPWMVAISFLRTFALVPMVILCNTDPRHHLPVIFNHDWEYILILGSLVFTNGYIQNLVFLSVSKLAPGKEEEALLLLIAFAAVATGLSSPLGVLIVKIL